MESSLSISWVTTGELLNLSVPRFFHLQGGQTSRDYLTRLFRGRNEIMSVELRIVLEYKLRQTNRRSVKVWGKSDFSSSSLASDLLSSLCQCSSVIWCYLFAHFLPFPCGFPLLISVFTVQFTFCGGRERGRLSGRQYVVVTSGDFNGMLVALYNDRFWFHKAAGII